MSILLPTRRVLNVGAWATNSLWKAAKSVPSLDLRFAENKSLVDSVSGQNRVTFSRASSATYVDANGVIQTAAANVPRFDHDPATGESLGLLVEESRTNAVTYSNYAQDSAWTKQNTVVIPNAAFAPDGTFTAAKIVETAVSGVHSVYRANLFSSNGSANTRSIYVKGGERRYVAFGIADTGLGTNDTTEAIFDTQTGTFYTNGYWVLGRTAQNVGNGWWRLSWYDTQFNGAVDGLAVGIASSTTAASISYAGDGTSGIYIWGAQVEAGSFPTSLIPTPATFTGRSGTATYYDANGTIQTAGNGVARSNAYFPDSNGVMRPAGLLLEAAATNNIKYSSDFTQSNWLNKGVVISTNATTSPDGTNNAQKLAGSTPTEEAYPAVIDNTNIIAISGVTGPYTASVFAKASELNFLVFSVTIIGDNNNSGWVVNLTTGESRFFRERDAFTRPLTVQKLPNGWYRVSFNFVISNNNGYNLCLGVTDSLGTGTAPPVYTGNGTSGIYVYGCQLESGSYASSYIPTTSSTVTRNADTSTSATVTRSADVASMTGSNFSSWYNQSQGTFVATSRAPDWTTSDRELFIVSDGTGTNAIIAKYSNFIVANSMQTRVYGSSVSTASQTFPITTSQNTFNNYAHAFAPGFSSSVLNGGTIAQGSPSSLPSVNRLDIGWRSAYADEFICGNIKRLAYYPARLTNTQLQTLTR